MEDSNEMLLRRYRSDIHSMCAAFPEPATAYKIKMEFQDNFDDEVPFRKFGYPSLDSFLNDHPNLVKVSLDGKVCYKAKLTEATHEIQSLIAKQKKKKRRGSNKKGRGSALQRGQYNRSFNAKNFPVFNPPPANRGGRSFSFSSRAANTFPSPDSVRLGSINVTSNSIWGRVTRPSHNNDEMQTVSNGRLAAPIPLNNCVVSPPPPKGDPTTGASQILRALERCSGVATITKLNYAYQLLFGKQLDGAEMMKYFGTNNMRKIHSMYLADKVELNAGYNGQWSFASKENAEKQREWNAQHKSAIIEEPRYRWDKPSVKELYEKTVEMLVNMYPETIPIDNMAEIYKRAHSVLVNPIELYCKNWDDLVLTTFKDKLKLTPNRHVALTPSAIASHNLSHRRPTAQKMSKMQRVTAEDLGLEYSDEDEDDDRSSLISVPSLPDDDLSDLFDPSLVEPSFQARCFGKAVNHRLTDIGDLDYRRPQNTNTVVGKPSGSVFSSVNAHAPLVPTATSKKSIFDRVTAPSKEIPEVQKSNPRVLTSVFGHTITRTGTSPEIRLPTGLPKHPSVFARQSISVRPKSSDIDVTDIINKELDKLELDKRSRRMDNVSQTERTKEAARKSAQQQNKIYGFGESEPYTPYCDSKPSMVTTSQKNDNGTTVPLYGFPSREATLEAFANASRNAQAILDRNNRFDRERENNQLVAFGQQDSSDFTVSPGKFNVKFNGRSEQLSNLVRSRGNQ